MVPVHEVEKRCERFLFLEEDLALQLVRTVFQQVPVTWFSHRITTIDTRVVHHSVILDLMSLESYRERRAQHQQHIEGGEASEQSPAARVIATTEHYSS